MSIVKTLRFPASIEWRGGRLTRASSPGKPSLDVATPPEFKGGVPGVWSPEDLLVAAVGSCFAVTLVAVAERSGVELTVLDVDGVGHIERAADGRFRFTVIELDVEVEADADPGRLERLAAKAEQVCIVSLALDVPVHVRLLDTARAA
ncbi:MAG TPA: OsmC family protein [Gaiellaceae bacterium]|nr:OsmC family protein [Gaiellaceae bacterium]